MENEGCMETNKQPRIMRDRKKLINPIIYIGVIVILSLFPLFIKSSYWIHVFILIFIYLIAAVSFRTIAISGQFPLGHAAFMGIGAYTAGCISRWLGWTPWLTIPLGAFTSMGIGILIGYPFARLRSLYYALVSLFFGVGIVNVIQAFGVWTGGSSGLVGIQPLLGTSKEPYYYFFLGLTSLSLLALYRFEFCRIGTTLKSIAQSHLVASSVGINEVRYRVLALAVGCFFVGLAGGCYAHYNLVLSTSAFNFSATLWLVLYTVIGGLGSFVGPIIGTALLILVPEIFRNLRQFTPYVASVMLLIVALFLPQGLIGFIQLVWSWYIKHRRGEKITHVT